MKMEEKNLKPVVHGHKGCRINSNSFSQKHNNFPYYIRKIKQCLPQSRVSTM